MEQKKLAKSNRVKRAKEKEVPLPPHLKRRKKKPREKRDTYISVPHKTNKKYLYDTKRLFQLSRYLKNEFQHGDLFTRIFPHDRPWGIKVDNDRHGRIVVVDVRLEESLNCANLKGIFVGDFIVDLNNIELALPMNILELFFDEIKCFC